MKKRYLCLLSLFIVFLLVSVAWSEEIDLYGAYLYRSVRGPNTVNYLQGDTLNLSGFVTPYYNNTEVTASYNHEGVTPISGLFLHYVGGGYKPAYEEYARSGPYNSAYTDSWLLTATNGANSDSLHTASLGDVAKIPFVRNVQLTGSGLTPTVSWEVPPSSGADRVVITVLANNGFRLWESPFLSSATNNYTIPENVLSPDTLYTVRVKLEQTSNGHTSSRTETFVNFTPLAAGNPNTVFLPVVGPDTNPNDNLGAAYQFDFDVTQGVPVFIDPLVAIGYDYHIGENNPLFASVTLPVLGDNKYDLYYLLTTGDYQYKSQILGGQKYFFEGGIDSFRILGIEETLGIDPNNATAFITELTFLGSGIFTGSMTPILSSVPEPTTMLLLGLGLIGLAGVRRKLKK